MSCRLPGAVEHPEQLWDLLASGRCTAQPGTRPGLQGRMAHWLDGDLFAFDHTFFRITEAEARAMDPQHRLLLEVVWRALEDAHLAPDRLAGRRVGVFVGLAHSEHKVLLQADPGRVDPWSGTGNTSAAAVGRLAHAFDWRGPALAVDTACSASLVALHLAMASLRRGESELAVVAGVNVLLDPGAFRYLDAIGALAPDGRCKAFRAAADGYGRAEGAAALVLGPPGATDRAWILGSATNHDGRSTTLTAPRGPAQEALIRAALADAGDPPVGWVEAHGTGTRLGDPIEAGALVAALAPGRPLPVSTLKAHLGHLEAAAGVAAVVRAVLSLERGLLLPAPPAGPPSPLLADLPLYLPERPEPLPPGAALVSAFGIGGSNAAAVLVPAPRPPPAAEVEGPHLGVASAASAAALSAWLPTIGPKYATDEAGASATLVHGRASLPWRRSWVGPAPTTPLSPPPSLVQRPPTVALAVVGQGAQRVGMGLGLLGWLPAFDEAVAQIDPLARRHLGRALPDLWGDPAALADPALVQPALFGLAWAQARTWASLGLVPDYLVGHSLGEWVAATLAGVLSLPDAFQAVVRRGRHMAAAPEGALLVVRAPAEALRSYLGEVELAATTHPLETTLGGSPPAVEAVEVALRAAGFATRRLPVQRAFHTSSLDGARLAFAADLQGLSLQEPAIPLVSTLTGTPQDAWTSPQRWADQIRTPVRFVEALRYLEGASVDLLLELGPRPVLAPAWTRTTSRPGWSSSDEDERSTWLATAGRLWERGVELDLRPLARARPSRLPPTPTEPRHLSALDAQSSPPVPGRQLVRKPAPAARPTPTPTWIDPGGPDRLTRLAAALLSGPPRPVLQLRPDPWAPALAALARSAALELGLEPTLLIGEGLPATCPADDRAAWTGERWWVEAPEDRPWPDQPAELRGRWLLTGASGAVGRALTDALRRAGAEVIGVSRRGPDRAIDLTDPEALTRLLAEPWAGVVHAAGALDDRVLARTSPETWARVFAPKVEVAAKLAASLPPGTPLVLVGSLAAVTGSPGQAAYAAANGALQGLAEARRAAGGSAITLHYGPWAGEGMAAGLQDLMRRRGLRLLDPPAAAACLLYALAAPPADWVIAQWEVAPAAAQTPTEAGLEAVLARALGREPPLPPEVPLSELGLDSLTALELVRRLKEWAGRDLPPTLLFEHPTLASLQRWWRGAPTPAAREAAPATPSLAVLGWSCRFPGVADPIDLLQRPVQPGPLPPAEPTGLSPGEARSLDPQHRLVLHLAEEAWRDAGQPDPARLAVLAIIGSEAWAAELALQQGLIEDPWAGQATGSGFAAGRIAHRLGAGGPALGIAATCASVLVALHLAQRLIAAGDADAAVIAGAHLALRPEAVAWQLRQGQLSASGQTRSFQPDADGWVRTEGGLALLVGPGGAGPARAYLEGSALAHPGQGLRLGSPKASTVASLARLALQRAGRAPTELAFIEAHGAGVPAADTVELEGLGQALGRSGAWLHTAKGALGHAEALSAGLGLLHAAVALGARRLPAQAGAPDQPPAVPAAGFSLPLHEVALDRPAALVSVQGAGGPAAALVLRAGARQDRVAALPSARPPPRLRCLRLPVAVPTFSFRLSAEGPEGEHRFGGQATVAATCWITLAWEAARALGRPPALEEVAVLRPSPFGSDPALPQEAQWALLDSTRWQIARRAQLGAGDWEVVVVGRLGERAPPPPPPIGETEPWPLAEALAAGGQRGEGAYAPPAEVRRGAEVAVGRLVTEDLAGGLDAGLLLRACWAGDGRPRAPHAVGAALWAAEGLPARAITRRGADLGDGRWRSEVWIQDGRGRLLAWLGEVISSPIGATEAAPPPRRWVADPARGPEGLRREVSPRPALQPGEVRVRPRWVGLNFRDALVSSGLYPGGSPPLGSEASAEVLEVGAGVDLEVGEAVVAFGPGLLADEAVLPAAGVLRRPAGLSPLQAAAWPVVGLSAWLALEAAGPLAEGDRILIHSGAGGLGQAALALARRRRLEPWVTAHPDKHAALAAQGVRVAGSSRDGVFARALPPVKAVIGAVTGEVLSASLQALAPGGRLIDLGAGPLDPDPRILRVDLGGWAAADPTGLAERLQDLLAWVAGGELPPLPVTVAPNATAGLRALLRGETVGKLVVDPQGQPAEAATIVSDLPGLLTQLAGQVLGGGPVSLDEPLGPRGLDSLAAVELHHRLGQALGRSFPLGWIWSNPTLRDLAQTLAPPSESVRQALDAELAELLGESLTFPAR